MNPIEQIVDSMNNSGIRPIPDGFDSLEKMIDVAFRHVKAVLIDQENNELIPVWAVLNNKGQTAILMTPFTDGVQSKDLAAMALSIVMKQTGAIRYTFACEAWTVHCDPNEGMPERPPSQDDRRIEVVMISGAERGQTLMKMWEIVRDDQAKIVELKPYMADVEGSVTSTGRFANLLEEIDA